jgi:hypothetical protein
VRIQIDLLPQVFDIELAHIVPHRRHRHDQRRSA